MDGIIIIDKPAGPTSAAIVRQLKAHLGKHARVGHLGTLDPFATGILPILIGEGTKLAPFLQEGIKEYTGLIALGSETDTLDSTGEVSRISPVPGLDTTQLAAIAARFTGTIEQKPPIFSAIKRRGVPLYKLARRGVEVEPPGPRRVEIHRLELKKAGGDTIRFTALCSSGMYVRSLARDIGIALNTAAHLYELRRIRNGAFSTADARLLDEVIRVLEQGDDPGLISMRAALATLPEVVIEPALESRLRNGDSRALDRLSPEGTGLFKVISRNKLIAIARSTSPITAAIVRVFGTGEENSK
ncbi:MAG: tRNA pseudouridine(55) synthase TruB [Deltaproteobacteria bacterium]|nr:tRNA pseudouridine(55) synthase TruB [Deltaproteobacteria bacterium]